MDVIDINGKLYDPYFILGVTKDDSSDHITRSFRKRVKKYHPDKYKNDVDKKKYECYFKILVASFEYIKEKRTSKKSIHLIDKSKYKHEVKPKSCNIDSFNKDFDNIKRDPNDYGYGENYTRLENIKEYDNLKVDLVNLFGKKKFSNKQFNKIFEWNKYKNLENDQSENTKQLIHKTTDGFSCYNSGIIDNSCSLVSSYNGLMIAGDDLGERGIGYWGNNYSDYSIVHKGAKNPVKKPKIPRKFTIDENIIDTSNLNDTKIYNEDKYGLDKKQYNDLLEKEQLDKEIVLKYIHKYEKQIADKALNDELEKSQSLTDILQKYIQN
jgi:curved DNA-binding protein CbpA